MQDIEQNMEELFRKAAHNYPLRDSDSQWEDIAPSLLNERINIPASKKTSSRKYITLLLLFLSLLISEGIIINTAVHEKYVFLQSTVESKISNLVIEKKSTGDDNKVQKEKRQGSGEDDDLQPTVPTISHRHAPNFINSSAQKQMIKPENAVENNQLEANSMIQHTTIKPITNTTRTLVSLDKKEPFTVGNKTALEKYDHVEKETSESKSSTVKIGNRHLTGLYLGVVTGPLFDEIKNQGLKKTGFNAGIIAGYQFKKHLSVETGLLFAKKPYFSSGKYFSMDKISSSMPPGMEILSLEGNNFVWEIPLRGKYDFLFGDKNNFFSSAGITSYIMTHEKNNYLVLMNGTQQDMTSSYKNKSRSLAATLDISVGYEHKISKTNRFRIEPYIQIPLKGMGVGAMPMMSSGIRIGITKFTN